LPGSQRRKKEYLRRDPPRTEKHRESYSDVLKGKTRGSKEILKNWSKKGKGKRGREEGGGNLQKVETKEIHLHRSELIASRKGICIEEGMREGKMRGGKWAALFGAKEERG